MLNEQLNAGQHKRISIYQTFFVFVPLFSKPIITKQINILPTKNSQEFLASQVSVLEMKPPTPVLLTVHYSVALKALNVLGNFFKVFRL